MQVEQVNTSSDGNAVTNKIKELETAIKKLTDLVSDSVVKDLGVIKSEIANCTAALKKHEEYVDNKFTKLEIENNALRRQLIRGDVLISGLPSTLSLDDLYSIVPKIGKVFEVDILAWEINMCSWIRNKKLVLVKFNSMQKRDNLMKRYFQTRNLQLGQIMDTDIQKRIYLNENMTPMAAKLNYLCRRLVQLKKIDKFRVHNSNIPEAKVVLPDGTTKNLNYLQANKLLGDDGPDINTQQNVTD